VRGGLFGGHVPGGGQYPDDVEVRVVEGECDRERGVDAGVGDEEYLSWHDVPAVSGFGRSSAIWSGREAALRCDRPRGATAALVARGERRALMLPDRRAGRNPLSRAKSRSWRCVGNCG